MKYLMIYGLLCYVLCFIFNIINAVRYTKMKLSKPPYEISLEDILLAFLDGLSLGQEYYHLDELTCLVAINIFAPVAVPLRLIVFIFDDLPRVLSRVKIYNKDALLEEELKK